MMVFLRLKPLICLSKESGDFLMVYAGGEAPPPDPTEHHPVPSNMRLGESCSKGRWLWGLQPFKKKKHCLYRTTTMALLYSATGILKHSSEWASRCSIRLDMLL